MAYDTALADKVRNLLSGRPGLAEKDLFGGKTFTLNDNMVASINSTGFSMRVGVENQEKALSMDGVKQKMLGPKAMNGMIEVEASRYNDDAKLGELVNWVADIVGALPPKVKKEKKAKSEE